MTTPSLISLPVQTPDGVFIASYSEAGLTALRFPSGRRPARANTVPPTVRRWHALTTAAVKAALAGRMPRRLPPLDWASATPFRQRVWAALLEIRCGTTQSYADMAQTVGQPGAARAVGGACGANPIPVLVPCHRVLAARGQLGGFSGGLDWKRTLLQREGRANRTARTPVCI